MSEADYRRELSLTRGVVLALCLVPLSHRLSGSTAITIVYTAGFNLTASGYCDIELSHCTPHTTL